jgi:hypothetical protein
MRTWWFSAVVPSVAWAVPGSVTHQGRVLDDLGLPVTGDHAVRVRLYDAADVVRFEQSFASVPFDDGYYALELDVDVPAWPDALGPTDRFLALRLDADPELPWRTALQSVPYARQAGGVTLGPVASCTTEAEGTLRFQGGALSVCHSLAWTPVASEPLGSPARPAASCREIKQLYPGYPSGDYVIDPPGTPAADPITVYCDQTTAGGGWTRVASIVGDVPVCSLAASRGTAEDVRAGQATAWFSAIQVNSFGWTDKEVLLYLTPTHWARYTSPHAAWTWNNIAPGSMHSMNGPVSYGVTYRKYGDAAFAPLPTPSGCTSTSPAGSCMLGGPYEGSSWYLLMGIGSYASGATTQNATCEANTAYKGMYRPGAWGQSGFVYVR